MHYSDYSHQAWWNYFDRPAGRLFSQPKVSALQRKVGACFSCLFHRFSCCFFLGTMILTKLQGFLFGASIFFIKVYIHSCYIHVWSKNLICLHDFTWMLTLIQDNNNINGHLICLVQEFITVMFTLVYSSQFGPTFFDVAWWVHQVQERQPRRGCPPGPPVREGFLRRFSFRSSFVSKQRRYWIIIKHL